MKKLFVKIMIIVVMVTIALVIVNKKERSSFFCLTGAFIADKPLKKDIQKFENNYGKKPFIVLVFIDWEKFVNDEVIKDIYAENCLLMVTWEPWKAEDKTGLDYNQLLAGKYDVYINKFAKQLKNIGKPVFLRFAHEMNGNWYPWSGSKIGKDTYIKMYRYIKERFEKLGADNVEWVFSINAEDVPKEKNNHFLNYYPGNKYVDYVGIDGYNWGNTYSWSKWTAFKDIFEKPYKEIREKIHKPVMITEFSSAETGGNKALWIKNAMRDIKRMKHLKAFILFNVDKEAKWAFSAGSVGAEELKKQLEVPYFHDKN